MHSQDSPKPKFWLVTGSDFARSIKWSKTWVNPVTEAIKKLKKP